MDIRKMTAAWAVIVLAAATGAEEKPVARERKPVAKAAAQAGAMLRREAMDKPWMAVGEKESLNSNDLIVGTDVGAAVVSNNGAVRLEFRGDFNGNSPYPILETAVVLNAAADVDLDVTLDRGRIDLINTKENGPAHVRVTVQDKSGEVVLKTPGARLSIEIFGRWPRGVPFKKDPKPDDRPAVGLVILAVKGECELKGKVIHLTLKAPPGPAMLQGDGLHTLDPNPVHLDALPEWAADSIDTERARKLREVLGRFRKLVVTKGVTEAIDTMVKSDDRIERRVSVILMGALDDLPHLGETLMNARDPEIWDAAVKALRHWIGRGPGQDQILYQGLIAKRGYKPKEAESVLQLLHSFSDEEVNRPELYEVLINYLGNDKLALRGLAHWHLERLVPAGSKIAYDPIGPKEQRDRAIAEWRKLIPSGKLPPEDK